VLLTNAVEPHASDVISEAWFYVATRFLKMLASKRWHFLSHFQSENGNEYSRWTVKEVFPLSFSGNQSSRERKVSGTKVPHRDYSFLGTKGLGHEKSRYQFNKEQHEPVQPTALMH